MPTPATNSPTTGTGGEEVQSPDLFAELTERQSMPQTTQEIKGYAKTQRLVIEKVGVVSRIRLLIHGSFKTKASGTPKLQPGYPWKMLREVALQANGVTGIIACSGPTLQGRRNRVFRNPASAILEAEKTGKALTESTTYKFKFVVEIPIAHDMQSLIGSLLAQNEETQLSIELTWASEEEIFNETGKVEKFEGEVEWTTTVFSIGSTVIGKKEVTVLPDLSAFHGIIQQETAVVGTGQRKAELIRTAGQLLCYGATILNKTGGEEQLPPAEWEEFKIEYGGNKDPLVWVPASELVEENADDYNGPVKVGVENTAEPKRGYSILYVDLERDNATRDMIIPESLTELRSVFKIPAAFSPSNAQIVTSQETLYPAVWAMAVPGFDDPALAAPLERSNLYFAQDVAVNSGTTSNEGRFGYRTSGATGQPLDVMGPSGLMFGTSATHTQLGAPIVQASKASRGHVSELLNFHGSPAPWVLIGILLVAGIIHLSARGRLGFGASVWVESLASILLTVLLIALVLAFAKGGMSEVGAWFHSKFVGNTWMPAVGIVLMLIGLWIFIRTLRGNLATTLTRTQSSG